MSKKVIRFFAILLVMIICFGMISASAASPYDSQIQEQRDIQDKAHRAADIFRELGYEDDCAHIKELSKIWWSAQNKIKEYSRYEYLGTFKSYAYCACTRCCGSYASGITATGTIATKGRTIAVDPNVIPLGSKVLINGKEYIAEDTGGGINGKTIDMFFNSHSAALNYGIRYVDIYMVR